MKLAMKNYCFDQEAPLRVHRSCVWRTFKSSKHYDRTHPSNPPLLHEWVNLNRLLNIMHTCDMILFSRPACFVYELSHNWYVIRISPDSVESVIRLNRRTVYNKGVLRNKMVLGRSDQSPRPPQSVSQPQGELKRWVVVNDGAWCVAWLGQW